MHGNGPRRLTAEERALVEQNMALVRHIVYQMANSGYVKHGLEEDAVQEGMMGLMNAARFFDPERGNAFTTLAGSCIKQKVILLVRREKRQEMYAAISLDGPMAEGNGKTEDRTWAEALPAAEDTEAAGSESLTETAIRKLEESGYQNHAAIVRMYALEGMNMPEIAKQLGLSKQCVHQRLRKAGEVLKRKMPDAQWK